jgi:1-acyl-sn-glycerol-3-phosphate acyltransferase
MLMNPIVKLLMRLYAWYVVLIFALTFLLMYPLFWIFLRTERTYYIANRLRRIWAHGLFILTAMDNRITFTVPLDPKRSYILCSNHASFIDIPLAALVLKGFNFKFMAKNQLAKIPVFNIFFKTVDIPVQRESKEDASRAYRDALDAIDKGYSLIIYPEGKTSKIVPRMVPFKTGAFRMAIEKQIPIVPVTFLDNWYLFPYNNDMLGKPGISRAVVHAPIETTGMTMDDVELLKNEVYQILDVTLREEYESRYSFSR